MKLPSDVARRAADDALLNIGVSEVGSTNSGKYVDLYLASVGLGPGYPWCAAWLYFRFMTAAARTQEPMPKGIPQSGYTPDWKRWAQKEGIWIPASEARAGKFTPKKGDICCFFFETMGRIAHIGLVVKDGTKKGFTSVEGNTGDDSGVNRDGGGVWKKTRTYASLGRLGGFIRVSDDPDGAGI